MIRLTAEATIKIDERRSIWYSANAEVEDDNVDLVELSTGMQVAVSTKAVEDYERLFPRPSRGRVPTDAGTATEAALERAALAGESKETDPMRTFGD